MVNGGGAFVFFVVPKLRLGMRPREALLRIFDSFFDSGFTPPIEIRQAELGMTHSQAELGNDRVGNFFWKWPDSGVFVI